MAQYDLTQAWRTHSLPDISREELDLCEFLLAPEQSAPLLPAGASLARSDPGRLQPQVSGQEPGFQ